MVSRNDPNLEIIPQKGLWRRLLEDSNGRPIGEGIGAGEPSLDDKRAMEREAMVHGEPEANQFSGILTDSPEDWRDARAGDKEFMRTLSTPLPEIESIASYSHDPEIDDPTTSIQLLAKSAMRNIGVRHAESEAVLRSASTAPQKAVTVILEDEPIDELEPAFAITEEPTAEHSVISLDDTREEEVISPELSGVSALYEAITPRTRADEEREVVIEHDDFKIRFTTKNKHQVGMDTVAVPKRKNEKSEPAEARVVEEPDAPDKSSTPDADPTSRTINIKKLRAWTAIRVLALGGVVGLKTGIINPFKGSQAAMENSAPIVPNSGAEGHSKVPVPDWMPKDIAAYKYAVDDIMQKAKKDGKIAGQEFVLVTNPNPDKTVKTGIYPAYDLVMDAMAFAKAQGLDKQYGLMGIPPNAIKSFMPQKIKGNYDPQDPNQNLQWGIAYSNSALIAAQADLAEHQDPNTITREQFLKKFAEKLYPDKLIQKDLKKFLVEKDGTWPLNRKHTPEVPVRK